MGNTGNRRAFINKFWYNPEYGLRNHLKYIAGDHRTVAVEKTKPVQYRAPLGADHHAVPRGRDGAMRNWAAARQKFTSLEVAVRVATQSLPEQPSLAGRDWAELHTDSPSSRKLDLLREQLFAAAMELHRCFCDAAPLEMNANLTTFVAALEGKPTRGAADGFAAASFLVPLWSTTFASMDRMTESLSYGDIGWLIVDEAGQATPQMAVGGLMVARNVIAVGDPIQVEPVVTLNTNVMLEIAKQFDLDADATMAPKASVQTYADAASDFCAEFPGEQTRTVGMPLLVHRRCAEPMFSISNEIGYGGLMVSARGPRPSQIRDIAGHSRWVSVDAKAEANKFCYQEWQVLQALLTQIVAGGAPLDMYVITPFRDIEWGVRQSLVQNWKKIGMTLEQKDTLYKRIGTIHKMQGREADTVVMLLGAQGEKNKRARSWAGGQPNILNVAATRAKENFYVIGNRAEWASTGYFGSLDRFMEDYEYSQRGDLAAPPPAADLFSPAA